MAVVYGDIKYTYPVLIQETKDTAKMILALLVQAERSREAFLGAAVIAIEPVVQAMAQRFGYLIEDTIRDGVLLSRRFTMSVDNMSSL
jgi:hypothetical protein